MTSGLELSEVDAAMCKALVDVLSGELEPGIGTAAATIARTVSAIRVAAGLEERLSALEELERSAGVGTVRRFGA